MAEPSVLLVQEMPDYLQEHGLLEPVARNTAAAVADIAVNETVFDH